MGGEDAQVEDDEDDAGALDDAVHRHHVGVARRLLVERHLVAEEDALARREPPRLQALDR